MKYSRVWRGLVKLMPNKEKNKTPQYDRYTIFSALLEAMNEKKQRKSKLHRLSDWLGLRK